MKFTVVCTFGKIEERKILKLIFKLVKVGGFDFPTYVLPPPPPPKVTPFFKRPLVDIQFDMPDLIFNLKENITCLRCRNQLINGV
jgi:hypothetical protein